MAINFRGRANVKYFMQTQVLRFYKDIADVSSLPLLKITTKSIHFLSAKKKTQKQPSRGVLRKRCAENMLQDNNTMNVKQIKYNRSQNLTSKHRAVKKICKLRGLFQKLRKKKQHNLKKNRLFSSSQ